MVLSSNLGPKSLIRGGLVAIALMIGLSVVTPFASAIVNAQATAEAPSDFSILVSPSPLFTTVKPGTRADMTLVIKNTGTGTENLEILPRKFSVDENTGEVKFEDAPSEIADWTTFSQPTFTLKPNQSIDEHIYVDVPENTGFSYSLALMVHRADDKSSTNQSGRKINGSVVVFTLINVDRPGAKRELQVVDFSSKKPIYEYLPATLNIKFKNTGNTILQPYGNIFIQRGSGDKEPLSTLEVNDKAGYILPGSSRLITADWSDGFPVYKLDASTGKTSLDWPWQNMSHFRIGPYTAKLITVYNNGHRDVSIEKEAGFWVFPWKIVLAALVVIAIFGFGLWVMVLKIWRTLRRRGKKHAHKVKESKQSDDE